MTIRDVVELLREHAVGTADASGSGFSDVIWRYKQKPDSLDLSRPWAEILDALQALTTHADGWETSGVPLDISYSIAEILTTALAVAATQPDGSGRRMVEMFAWRVACGWEGVLAGDIESIGNHVRDEALARGIGALTPEDESDR